MNLEDRVGGQDETAAALFAAARAYRPPARARRRAWRALGLPVGLSLLAPGLAQAAVAAFASAKGWIVVAGVVAVAAGAVEVAHVVGARREAGAGRAIASPAASRAVRADQPPSPIAAGGPGKEAVDRVVVASVGQGGHRADAPGEEPGPQAAMDKGRGGGRGRGPASAVGTGMRAATSARTVTPTPRPAPTATDTAPETMTATATPAGTATAPAVTAPAAMGSRASAEMGSGVSSLRAELAMVGEARARLRAGDARATLALLADYPRRFPAGALAEEVDLLAMRALVAAGAPARARRRGGEFLARHPGSPLAGAVRALLDSPIPSGQEGDER